jgi:molybdate transport system regulatory protein
VYDLLNRDISCLRLDSLGTIRIEKIFWRIARAMKSLSLKSRHWLVNKEGQIVFGEGRKKIFENIEQTGSMYQTARNTKMSYKAVWSKIKYTEKHLNTKIVHSDRKMGTRLTGEGKNLLEKYRALKKKCLMADDKIFKDIFTQT